MTNTLQIVEVIPYRSFKERIRIVNNMDLRGVIVSIFNGYLMIERVEECEVN